MADAVSQAFRDIGCEAAATVAEESVNSYEYDVAAVIRQACKEATSDRRSAVFTMFQFINDNCAKLLFDRNNLRNANREYDAAAESHGAEVTSLQTRNAVLQAQLEGQTALVAGLRSLSANPTAPKRSIAKDPAPFKATEKDASKRHVEYQNWRSKIMVRWAQDSHEFPDEYKKILHIAGLLDGQAYQSIHKGISTIIEYPQDHTKWAWVTGADLVKVLDKTYSNLDVTAEAEKKLSTLEQKDDYKNFSDFITEFMCLCDRADLDDGTRVRFLRAKVNTRLRKAIANQVNQPERADWSGWLDLTSKLAKNIEQEEFQTKLYGNSNNQGNGQGNQGNNGNGNAAKKDPDAMDLSNIRTKITPAEYQYRMDNGLCKRCGNPGHIAINCTPAHRSATSQSNRGASSSNRGNPRGGGSGRGYSRGGSTAWNGNTQYPNPGNSHPGGRGYTQPYQQYQPSFQPRTYQPQGQHVRWAGVGDEYYHQQPQPLQPHGYYGPPPIGYVEGEVDDTSTVDLDQGKENPPR